MTEQKHLKKNLNMQQEEICNLKIELKQEKIRLRKLGINIENDILSDQNIAEILGTHPTPMAHSLFCSCFAHDNGAIKIGRNIMGYDIGEELNQGFQIIVGGQPRCSIVHDALSYRIKGIPLKDYSEIIKYYLKCIKNDPQLANYPEIILYEQNPSLNFLENIFKDKAAEYKTAYKIFFENIRTMEEETAKRCEDEFILTWKKKMKRLEKQSRNAQTIPEMNEVIRKTVYEMRTDACVMFVLVARMAFSSYARLKKELQNKYGETEGKKKLDLVTTSENISKYNPTTRFTTELYKLKCGKTTISDIIEEFGHISLNELEIANPRYWELPKLLQAQANSITINPKKSFESVRIESLEKENEIGQEYPELMEDINKAKTYLSLRECVKFEFLRGYNLTRKMLKNIEHKLGWTDNLIFFLGIEETMAINDKTKKELFRTAQNRKLDLENKKNLYVPAVLESENLSLIGNKLMDKKLRILKGIGATDKIAEGEVVLLNNPYDITAILLLKPGKILVAKTTDPSWTSYIGAIAPTGGLITEIGGFGSHCAVVSREFGISAVMNVPYATQILKTGMKVRMDGKKGIIEIL